MLDKNQEIVQNQEILISWKIFSKEGILNHTYTKLKDQELREEKTRF